MPLYEYRCTSCGYTFEKIQSFSAKPETECPKCHGELIRPVTAPALRFEGAGWYVNDYAGKGKSKSGDSPAAAASGESSSASSSASEKPAAKSSENSTPSTPATPAASAAPAASSTTPASGS